MNGRVTTAVVASPRQERRRGWLSAILPAVEWLGVGLLSYLLADKPFLLDLCPYGIALVASAPGAAVLPALLGGVLAVRSGARAIAYTATFVGIFLLRTAVAILFHRGGFPPPRAFYRETAGARAAVACLAALGFGTYQLVINGYLYFDVFRMAFFAVVAAVLTGLLSGGFRLAPASAARACHSVGLALLGVAALAEVAPGGVRIGLILALGCTLYAAHLGGAAAGGAVGLLLSLPLGMAEASTVLGAAGMCAGLFFGVSRYLALASACVVALAVGVSGGGFSGLMELLPETVSVCVLMYPLLKYDVLPRPREQAEVSVGTAAMEIAHTEGKMELLTRTFSALSELMGAIGGKKDDARKEGPCVAACEEACRGCGSYGECWQKHRQETLGAVSELTEILRLKGEVEDGEVPKVLTARCSALQAMLSEVKKATHKAQMPGRSWGRGNEETMAVQYDNVSRLFRQVLSEKKASFAVDEPLTARTRYGMGKAGFPAERVTVYGGRKKRIVAENVEVATLDLGCDDVRRLFENLTGLRLSTPSFAIDGRRITMTLESRRRYRVESASRVAVLDGEEVSGDTVNLFYGCDDRFYGLISDGMGSGEDAAQTSGLCSVFLEKLLAGGADRETALRLLNECIRSRRGECSATVDLTEVDLLTGEALFSKSGAAPSFVKRGADVFKLHSKTIPMGIVRETDAEEIRFPLKRGDVVIMISDGVSAGFEESGWLLRMISEEWVEDLDEMCRRILDGAKANNLRTDDMSVCLFRLV